MNSKLLVYNYLTSRIIFVAWDSKGTVNWKSFLTIWLISSKSYVIAPSTGTFKESRSKKKSSITNSGMWAEIAVHHQFCNSLNSAYLLSFGLKFYVV